MHSDSSEVINGWDTTGTFTREQRLYEKMIIGLILMSLYGVLPLPARVQNPGASFASPHPMRQQLSTGEDSQPSPGAKQSSQLNSSRSMTGRKRVCFEWNESQMANCSRQNCIQTPTVANKYHKSI